METDFEIKSDVIELKFDGNSIKPSALTNSEVARMLIAFEELVLPFIAQEYPEISFNTEELISYHDIGNRSFSIRNIIKLHKREIKQAISTLLLSINLGLPDAFPKTSARALHKIASFSTAKGCTANLGFAKSNVFNPLAEITAFKKETFKNFKLPKAYNGILVKLETENPKAHFRLANGTVLSCSISKQEIKKYRQLIDEEVRVTGLATISGKTLKRKSFEIESIEKLKLFSAAETISALRRIVN